MNRAQITMGLAAGLVLFSAEAQAINRYSSQAMSCARVQATVRQEGAAILRYTSPRGQPLYNRFVRSDRFCQQNERAENAFVPTADRGSCPVMECQKVDPRDRFWWLRPRHR